MIRNPAVAGQFYSGQESELRLEIKDLIGRTPKKKEDAIGIISPHAGYMYSGMVAAAVLASVKPKSNYIIMGPNHTGLGAPFSISTSDSWKTPLGEVGINNELREAILRNCPLVKKDEFAHVHEHSIEVQLPFLQVLQKTFSFVPIVIAQADIAVYKTMGEGLAAAIKELKIEKDTMIVASSDMTHYEAQQSAKDKDSRAIDAILSLDEDSLMERIEKFDITMCGAAPAAVMMAAAKHLGAKKGRLVKYRTSADASGDYSSVVGYAGIVIT